jgi:hypothetical protein
VSLLFVYQNHSGSLANGASGYEVSVDLPASYMYNLTGVDFYYFGQGHSYGCVPVFSQPGGTLNPAYYIYRGSTRPYIQFFDNVVGWHDLYPMDRFFDERGMGQPRGASSYALASKSETGAFTPHVSNPVSFRLINRPATYYTTVSWTGFYFALADECFLAPAAPAAYVGMGEGGVWSLVGAPNTSGTSTDTSGSLDTLPNGAPLAGRNRVQLIS